MIALKIILILYYIISVGYIIHYLISEAYESDELTVAKLIGYIITPMFMGPFVFPIFLSEKLDEIKIRKKKPTKTYYSKQNDIINEEVRY